MADPLMRIPGLGGYLRQKQLNEEESTRQLGRVGSFMTLRQAFQEQDEMERVRQALAAGGDAEAVVPALLRAGPKGAAMAQHYITAQKGAEELRSARETREALGSIRSAAPATTPAQAAAGLSDTSAAALGAPWAARSGQPQPQQQQGRQGISLRDAAVRLAPVNPKLAEQFADIAKKIESETGTTPHVLEINGKPVIGVYNKSGQFIPTQGATPEPKFRTLNLGGTTQVVNERDLPAAGRTFSHSMTPGEADASGRGWAGLNRPQLVEGGGGFQWVTPPRVGPQPGQGVPGVRAGLAAEGAPTVTPIPGITSPRAGASAASIRSEQEAQLKPVEEVALKISKIKQALASSTPASDVQVQQLLTDVFDDSRATNLLFSSNRNFGSLAGRMSGFISRAFTGQYSDEQRAQIRAMVDEMESNVVNPTRDRITTHYSDIARRSGVPADLVRRGNLYGDDPGGQVDPQSEADAFLRNRGR